MRSISRKLRFAETGLQIWTLHFALTFTFHAKHKNIKTKKIFFNLFEKCEIEMTPHDGPYYMEYFDKLKLQGFWALFSRIIFQFFGHS